MSLENESTLVAIIGAIVLMVIMIGPSVIIAKIF